MTVVTSMRNSVPAPPRIAVVDWALRQPDESRTNDSRILVLAAHNTEQVRRTRITQLSLIWLACLLSLAMVVVIVYLARSLWVTNGDAKPQNSTVDRQSSLELLALEQQVDVDQKSLNERCADRTLLNSLGMCSLFTGLLPTAPPNTDDLQVNRSEPTTTSTTATTATDEPKSTKQTNVGPNNATAMLQETTTRAAVTVQRDETKDEVRGRKDLQAPETKSNARPVSSDGDRIEDDYDRPYPLPLKSDINKDKAANQKNEDSVDEPGKTKAVAAPRTLPYCPILKPCGEQRPRERIRCSCFDMIGKGSCQCPDPPGTDGSNDNDNDGLNIDKLFCWLYCPSGDPKVGGFIAIKDLCAYLTADICDLVV